VIASGLSRGASREAIEEQLIWVPGVMPERAGAGAAAGTSA